MSELKQILINISEEKNTKILPENLKAGVEAFGVQGNFTADATATSADIAKDKTAYVNGEKVTGVMETTESNYNCMFGATITAGSTSGTSSNIYKYIKKIDEELTLNTALGTYLFYNCSSLEEAPKINAPNTTNWNQSFYGCSAMIKATNIDTSAGTSFSGMFYGCKKLVEVAVDTSNGTDFSSMFNGCKALIASPDLNTSKATSMAKMFNGCTSLTTVSVLDTSNITTSGMNGMFSSCTNLSEESLNNILAMCTNATKITSSTYMKLSYVGLTEAQATTCTTLSNYQAFLDAGWITGY